MNASVLSKANKTNHRLRRRPLLQCDFQHFIPRRHGAVVLYSDGYHRGAATQHHGHARVSRLGRLLQFFQPSATNESYTPKFIHSKQLRTYSFSTDMPRMGNNGVPVGEAHVDIDGLHRQTDFIGEAITLIKDMDVNTIQGLQSQQKQSSNQTINNSQLKGSRGSISDVISSFDGMSLCILSKGSANLHTGNDAEGPDAKAFHSAAMAWSELLRYASAWNNTKEEGLSISTAPMLVVAAVAPVVAQGGSQYLHRIDKLLSSTRESTNAPPPNLWAMANYAVSYRDAFLLSNANGSSGTNPNDSESIHYLLTPRERWHLHALHQLLHDNHQAAMGAYLRLLEIFPGDLLGLSLALDVAYSLGDSTAALR